MSLYASKNITVRGKIWKYVLVKIINWISPQRSIITNICPPTYNGLSKCFLCTFFYIFWRNFQICSSFFFIFPFFLFLVVCVTKINNILLVSKFRIGYLYNSCYKLWSSHSREFLIFLYEVHFSFMDFRCRTVRIT